MTAGKKVKGRKRHIVTDIMGNILKAKVHAANIHDTVSGGEVFEKALRKYPSLKGICADEGYRKTFKEFVEKLGKTCDISEKIIPKGWAVIPRRWRVERTFGWLTWFRRLSKDYEISTSSEENMIMIAHSNVLLRRLCY